MGRCLHCSKRGIFLITNKNGLCKNCISLIKEQAERWSSIINESIDIITRSKNTETLTSRCVVIINMIEKLDNYERLGFYKSDLFLLDLKNKYYKIKESLINKSKLLTDSEKNSIFDTNDNQSQSTSLQGQNPKKYTGPNSDIIGMTFCVA